MSRDEDCLGRLNDDSILVYIIYLKYIIETSIESLGEITALASDFDASKHNAVFKNIEFFLHSVSAVSRIIWPGRTRGAGGHFARARGELLRAKIGLDDNMYIKERAVRDHITHIDERFDEWIMRPTTKNIIIRSTEIDLCNGYFSKDDIFELFNTKEIKVYFGKDCIDLCLLGDEMRRILNALDLILSESDYRAD